MSLLRFAGPAVVAARMGIEGSASVSRIDTCHHVPAANDRHERTAARSVRYVEAEVSADAALMADA